MEDKPKPAKLLVNRQYRLQKYPGKGGWTYAEITEAKYSKRNPFGWVEVKGSIDGFELKNYKLMPLGNSRLFLPVRAEIRKKIGKEEGDWVHVILYADNDELSIPEEFQLCLNDEPDAAAFYAQLSRSKQKEYLDFIFAAKTDATKVKRIADSIDKLAKKKSFHD